MNLPELHIDWSELWNSVILIAGILFLVFEFKRTNTTLRKLLRIVALCAAVISAIALLNNNRNTESTQGTAIIVTDGHEPDALKNLKYKNPDIFRHDLNPYELPSADKYDSVIMLGYGIHEPEITGYANVLWDKPLLPSGITDLKIPDNVWVNNPANFKVLLNNINHNKLIISDLYSNSDTLNVNSDELAFTWNFRIPGRQLLSMNFCDSALKVLETDVLDVFVETPPLLNFLILASSPSSEFRFLKEHLAREGHRITVRSQVGKSAFIDEFINTPTFAGFMNSLSDFDVIFCDQRAINGMSANQRNQLLEAIKAGTGLMIMLPEPLKGTSGLKVPSFTSSATTEFDYSGQKLNSYPFQFTGGSSITSLPTLLSGIKIGEGNVLFSFISSSYPLLLRGDSVHYRELWSEIIYKTARVDRKSAFRFPPIYEREVNRRMELAFYGTSMPEIRIEGIPVPVAQDLIIPEKWNTDYWPRKAGWHTMTIFAKADTLSRDFFVPDSSQWAAARARRIVKVNESVFRSKADGKQYKKTQPPVDYQLWWLCLLLISFGILWLEPRI